MCIGHTRVRAAPTSLQWVKGPEPRDHTGGKEHFHIKSYRAGQASHRERKRDKTTKRARQPSGEIATQCGAGRQQCGRHRAGNTRESKRVPHHDVCTIISSIFFSSSICMCNRRTPNHDLHLLDLFCQGSGTLLIRRAWSPQSQREPYRQRNLLKDEIQGVLEVFENVGGLGDGDLDPLSPSARLRGALSPETQAFSHLGMASPFSGRCHHREMEMTPLG